MCAFAHRELAQPFSFPLRGVCVVFRRRKAEQTFLYLTDSPYPVKLVSVREPILQYLRDVFCVERRCARARVFDNEHERDLRIFGRGEAAKKRRCLPYRFLRRWKKAYNSQSRSLLNRPFWKLPPCLQPRLEAFPVSVRGFRKRWTRNKPFHSFPRREWIL